MVEPLMMLPFAFLLGSWFSIPFSNLCHDATPMTPLVLRRVERMVSNLFGTSLAIATIGGLAFLVTLSTVWLILTVVCILLLVPIGDAAKAYGTRASRPFTIGATLVAGCGTSVVLMFPWAPRASGILLAVLFVSVILWSSAANRLFARYE